MFDEDMIEYVDPKDVVRYYIIPTIIVAATDDVLDISINWWTWGIGFQIIKS